MPKRRNVMEGIDDVIGGGGGEVVGLSDGSGKPCSTPSRSWGLIPCPFFRYSHQSNFFSVYPLIKTQVGSNNYFLLTFYYQGVKRKEQKRTILSSIR